MPAPADIYSQIISLIKAIPHGRVATYGQIARLTGWPRSVRQVVWALHSSSSKRNLPWHRVINRHGKISLPPPYQHIQRQLLEAEGVYFNLDGRVDLSRFQWTKQPLQNQSSQGS